MEILQPIYSGTMNFDKIVCLVIATLDSYVQKCIDAHIEPGYKLVFAICAGALTLAGLVLHLLVSILVSLVSFNLWPALFLGAYVSALHFAYSHRLGMELLRSWVAHQREQIRENIDVNYLSEKSAEQILIESDEAFGEPSPIAVQPLNEWVFAEPVVAADEWVLTEEVKPAEAACEVVNSPVLAEDDWDFAD